MIFPWVVAAVCAGLAVWAIVLARRARQQSQGYRAEALHRMRELESLGYDHNRVGRRVSAIGDASVDAILVCRADHSVIYLNPAAEALFGKAPDNRPSLMAVTRHYDIDRLATDALGAREDLDRQILVNGRACRARAANYEGGVVIVLSDVSELQRLGRTRRDFVANISHELRTPLTSIRLLLDGLLAGGVRDPEASAAALKKVEVEVQALQQMAQELLDLSQIESGRALVRLVPTQVAGLVASTVERLAPQIESKAQTISVDVPAGLTALADADQVSRVLSNLIHNASKFTPAGGRINVEAHLLDGDVQIDVLDSGPGIPPDDLPRVFERFFRGDRSRQGGGTGLGLAVAKHVIEAHGGRIWVESEGRPGKGAVFRFTLPAAES